MKIANHLFVLPMFFFSRIYLSSGFLSRGCHLGSFPRSSSALFGSSSKKSIKTRSISPLYTPKTQNQEKYTQYLSDPDCSVIIAYGSAGTGKTLFACTQAVEELKGGRIHKIILTRPIVSVDKEELGFLPGNIVHKMDPWTRPLFDILLEYYSQKDIDSMLHSGVLEISPLAYMRGRTFKRSFIIADEMQNSSPNQMLMLATRIGSDSRMVITGDLKQSDRGQDNGLHFFINKLKSAGGFIPEIKMVEMVNEDVQRSQIVNKILDLFSDDSTTLLNKNNTMWSSSASPCEKCNNVTSVVVKPTLSYSYVNQTSVSLKNDAALLPTKYLSSNKKFIWDPTPL